MNYKKIILLLTILFGVLGVGFVSKVKAITPAEIQAQINQLSAMIAQLQAQLGNIEKPKPSEPKICTDSDGGMNYGKKGTVFYGEKSYVDHCIDNSMLKEYFCRSTYSEPAEEVFFCAYGCKEGVCQTSSPPLLYLSYDSSTPSSTNVFAGSRRVSLVNYKVEVKGANFTTPTITLQLDTSKASVSDIENIYIYENGLEKGKGQLYNTGRAMILVKTVIPDGSSTVLEVKADISPRAVAGHQIYLYIANIVFFYPYDYYFHQVPIGLPNPMTIVSTMPVCTDSDGGKNYYVKGCIYYQGFENSIIECDTCSSGGLENNLILGQWVVEKYCSSDGGIGSIDYKCPNGCRDGACLKAPLQCLKEYNSCCLGSVCTPFNCNEGYFPVFKCDSNCKPIGECQPKPKCVQKDTSCCLKENCTRSSVTCVQGYTSVFKGCDANCSPIWECKPSSSNRYYLDVINILPSGGRVVSEPSGIDCGKSCSVLFDKDKEVTLTAYPFKGYLFTHWSGDCTGTNPTCTLTMNSEKDVTAHFSPANVLEQLANVLESARTALDALTNLLRR